MRIRKVFHKDGSVSYYIGKREVSKREYDRAIRRQRRNRSVMLDGISGGNCGTWPFASYAAGVHPAQVPKLAEMLRRAGIPTDFTSEGDPIFTSRKHRKKYCEFMGLYDRNGGYSDPQRK